MREEQAARRVIWEVDAVCCAAAAAEEVSGCAEAGPHLARDLVERGRAVSRIG